MMQTGVLAPAAEFVDLIAVGRGSVEANEQALAVALDQLALAYHRCEKQFDGTPYPDPPQREHGRILALARSRFPNYGYYNTPDEVSTNLASTRIVVADAINDIAEISGDMHKTLWRWENTSEVDALWHFQWGYHFHWGAHLRGLQFYLYYLQRE
jgi:multidrug efflux pump subunit AcrA (membrane-fusion protein)